VARAVTFNGRVIAPEIRGFRDQKQLLNNCACWFDVSRPVQKHADTRQVLDHWREFASEHLDALLLADTTKLVPKTIWLLTPERRNMGYGGGRKPSGKATRHDRC
jgi:hypothetical protein